MMARYQNWRTFTRALQTFVCCATAVSAADPPIRALADLVLVPVTVTDRNGAAISGLLKQQIRILDNDEPRSVLSFERDRSPSSIVVVADCSASMRSKRQALRQALEVIAASAGPADEAALVTFSDKARVRSGFTKDITDVTERAAFEPPAGETALLDAVWAGFGLAKQGHHARRSLIVITDGGDNHSRRTAAELRAAALEADVQVYAISVHEQTFSMAERSGSALLKRLAESTGGLHFEIGSSRQLPEAARRIADATRNLYIAGFRPPEGRDRTQWRRIRVLPADRSGKNWRMNARSAYRGSSTE